MKQIRKKYIGIGCILLFVSVVIICSIYQLIFEERIANITYDDFFSKQWYLQNAVSDFTIDAEMDEAGFTTDNIIINSKINLGITDFWAETYNKKLTIAVIDSKVDIEHEDLSKHIWCNINEVPDNKIDDDNNGYIDDYYGWNFYSDSNQISSKNSDATHGTHCAGIIAADHNDIGVMGVLGNTNVKIMVLPIFQDINSEIDYQNLVAAITYANEMGADICNISSICLDGSEYIYKEIENSDMIFVVAAGNFQNSIMKGLNLEKYPRYPACTNLANVVTVGSINEKKEYSVFSNYSSQYVDITAPGEYIYSSLPNNEYGYASGTSMATPIVTGILGAYYYNSNGNRKEALALLYSCSAKNNNLKSVVNKGRIVHFQKN